MKPRRHLKPHKDAIWDEKNNRWAWDLDKVRSSIRKAQSRIRPVSDKQKKENELYRRLKPVWRANPRNHFCTAICKELHIKTPALPYPHHVRGRGKLLNDLRFWKAVCDHCHRWIESHRKAAKAKGWLASRDAKTIKLETNPRKQHG